MFNHVMCASALVFAALASQAQGAEITLGKPMAAGVINETGVDMVVFYSGQDDVVDVIATYVFEHDMDQPRRLAMQLAPGDVVSFGLPGKRGTIYQFANTGDAVTVKSKPTNVKMAQH